nr:ribonuclease E inhibitor RraB [Pedobacter panaciterrae]
MQADLKQLKGIFIKMSEDGFDIKSSLKWSFYFIDKKKQQLEKLYREMEQHDYWIENFEENDENEWVLKVSKIDILNPEKLHKRNIAFNELANYCDVKLYDGWDVEKLCDSKS